MNRATVKMAKLFLFFWKVFRFRGSVLLIYNEGTFSVVDSPSNWPNFRIYF